MEKTIRKYALQNAIKFNGKANPGAVIGKIIAEFPDEKQNMKNISQKVNQIISEINSMSVNEQTGQLKELAPELLEKQEKQEKSELPELNNAEKGSVITRMAPEPSKYNHIGHAISFLINYMYAKKYEGKCVMRFDDTNPEKESQEYVDAMKKDVIEYLGIQPDWEVFASDHMNKYYKYAEQLIQENDSYVCFCPQESISKMRREMIDCPHRIQTAEQNKEYWEKMKNGDYKEGQAILRLKIDMKHKNAVMRDPVIFRLSYSKHYKYQNKYDVWPMYDFESAVEEGLNRVTHVLRSNEFDTRIELHNYIAELLGFSNVEYKHYGRFNITGAVSKGREIKNMIESGKYIGWDDPRLITLRALKRRGIVKESIYELTKKAGLSKQQTNIDYSLIASINRSILDKRAKRFFFIKEPVKIEIQDMYSRKIKLNLHPEKKDGERKFSLTNKFLIEKKDFDEIKENEVVRLMDCINFIKKNNQFFFDSQKYEQFKEKGKKIVHWLPNDESIINVGMMMDNAEVIHGKTESNAIKLNKGDIIQFERFGFARLDEIRENSLIFWFSHF